MEELENTTNGTTGVEQGPITIPFGGRVCLGTGLYKNADKGLYAGSLEIGWMDRTEEIGKWMDESVRDRVAPLVRCVFTDIDSIDAMVKQLVLLEYFMSKDKLGSEEEAFEDVCSRLHQSFEDTMNRIEEIESGVQETEKEKI